MSEDMNAYSKVQQTRGSETCQLGPTYEVRVYPNVIELWDRIDAKRIVALTPEEWAAIVQFVGIRGLEVAPC